MLYVFGALGGAIVVLLFAIYRVLLTVTINQRTTGELLKQIRHEVGEVRHKLPEEDPRPIRRQM